MSWPEYYAHRSAVDPHGISAEDCEVNEDLYCSWDSFWRWADTGLPVEGVLYFNYGKAIKAARKYNFLLPEVSVQNHARLKAAREAGAPAFAHPFSWRLQAPDYPVPTVMKKEAADG